MKTQRELMVSGELYDPMDSEIERLRNRSRDILARYNATTPAEQDIRNALMSEFLGCHGRNLYSNGVVIGAGSVVTRDVPDNCVVAGNPARIILTIEQD